MNEKVTITIHNLDDVQGVLKSLELLFQKLIYYYAEKDLNNLKILVLSCSVWFGMVLQKLGYSEDDFKE
jgi:hypothetical protein